MSSDFVYQKFLLSERIVACTGFESLRPARLQETESLALDAAIVYYCPSLAPALNSALALDFRTLSHLSPPTALA
jgi:hypothetical protein